MAIKTTVELEQALKARGIPFTKVTPLNASTNFVWRIQAPDSSSTIIKHAEPYSKDSPDIPISTDRLDFEKKALEKLLKIIPQDDILRLPALRFYDADDKILQISDAGLRTLDEVYRNRMLNIPLFGRRIGKWLARLHASTRREETRNAFLNESAKEAYRKVYDTVPGIFSEWGHDASVVESINAKYGAFGQSESACVCHGDFSPENIVAQSAVAYGFSNHKLTVVDWEMVHDGCGSSDVAQFAADAWLLDRFKGGRELFGNFLRGYGEGVREGGGEVDDLFKKRAAAHFAAYLTFASTKAESVMKEETAQAIKLGFKILEKVLANDMEFVGTTFPGL
ncbi:uncharacterized protein BDZ99DRAFT_376987 [Mytilinidion resinicola]|uniref:Aminoglycoside phosphotransferase domain-containing protein n=1 Tax=Mytilinidion resinicola TaxID=574789 RepID=A0A6A6Z6G3_9PEZI|nr:uncharacterized protein BDZ99DRAFT_376987 [Mytilinidion resinicola]KAF2816691.1 hypothetical protein BDZ99DRAFT_376987 [Mytilinidion resinicola]